MTKKIIFTAMRGDYTPEKIQESINTRVFSVKDLGPYHVCGCSNCDSCPELFDYEVEVDSDFKENEDEDE